MATDPAPPRRRRARRWLLILGVELVAVLLLLELGLRVAMGRSAGLRRWLYMSGLPSGYHSATTLEELMALTPHGFVPLTRHGDFVLNSRSLKEQEYSVEKAPGTRRIVVLGDSFTFDSGGVAYRDLWHVRLEDELSRSAPVEIVSLGVRSVGPDFYLRMWQLEGSRLDADLVVVAFYLGNDFSDVVVAPSAPSTSIDGLARRSLVVRLVRNTWLDATGVAPESRPASGEPGKRYEVGGVPIPELVGKYAPRRAVLSEKRFLTTHGRILKGLAKSRRERLEEVGGLVWPYLDGLREATDAAGIPLVLTILPAQCQVDPELEAQVAAHAGLAPGNYDLDATRDLVARWAADAGVPTLDLVPVFRAEIAERPLYGGYNTHWNADGNELAARELADFLAERGLLEPGEH